MVYNEEQENTEFSERINLANDATIMCASREDTSIWTMFPCAVYMYPYLLLWTPLQVMPIWKSYPACTWELLKKADRAVYYSHSRALESRAIECSASKTSTLEEVTTGVTNSLIILQWEPDKWDSIQVGFLCKWDGLDETKIQNIIQNAIHKWDSCVRGTLDSARRVSHLWNPHCTSQLQSEFNLRRHCDWRRVLHHYLGRTLPTVIKACQFSR